MKEQLIDFETAKLAKEKGFDIPYCHGYHYRMLMGVSNFNKIENWNTDDNYYTAPTQSLLQKYIREERGVLICIYRNASGYLWSIDKNDGGIGLGWSDYRSNEKDKGGFTSFEFALEDILYLSLLKTLEEFKEETKNSFHWGNYADYLIEQSKLI